MGTVESAGTSIHYEVAGTGPPLVLLHGLPLTGSSWRQAGYLEALTRRFRCIMVDARGGAGSSDKPDLPADHTRDLYVADVLAVLKQEQVGECAVWGFSWSGGVGSALAAEHPDRVRALVLTGAFDIGAQTLEEIEAQRPRVDLARAGGMDAMLADWEPAEEPPLPAWFREMVLTYDARAWRAARIAGWGWPHVRDDRITAPTLVIVGSREDPDDEASSWAEQLPRGWSVTVLERPGRGRAGCGTADPRVKVTTKRRCRETLTRPAMNRDREDQSRTFPYPVSLSRLVWLSGARLRDRFLVEQGLRSRIAVGVGGQEVSL